MVAVEATSSVPGWSSSEGGLFPCQPSPLATAPPLTCWESEFLLLSWPWVELLEEMPGLSPWAWGPLALAFLVEGSLKGHWMLSLEFCPVPPRSPSKGNLLHC